MKTIVQTGPKSVETQDRDRPDHDDDEVLVRVNFAGLCGSDAHAYKYDGGYEWIQIPRIMGHEYAGEVVEVGEAVTEFTIGDKVVEEPIHHCSACFQCNNGQSNVCQNFEITGMHTDGAYAEFTAVEAKHLHRLPDSVSLEQACITEPLSIATRAVFTQSRLKPGNRVLVEGPGPIGVLVASVANSMGADVIVSGIKKDGEYRLPLLDRLGIDTIDVETNALDQAVAMRTDGLGFDVVFDTTGHRSGVETAVDHVRKGGQIVVVGLPATPSEVFFTPVVRGEIRINTSYGSTWQDFEHAIRIIESGDIDFDVIIDRSYGIDDPAAAFEAFLNAKTCKPIFSFKDV